MTINLTSGLSATTIDPSTDINHIVWADNEFIYHATYNSNSGTWENATSILSIGNQTISNLNLVISDALISEGQSNLPGLAVVWQEGDKNNSELYYTAAQYNEVQKLQWLETPQPLTADEIADLEPKVIVKDNEIIVVSTKVNIDNGSNLSIKEDTDVYFQKFTVDSSLFNSPQNVATAKAVYSPRLVNNRVVNRGVVNNASYNPFTDNEILAFNETILASDDSSFEGLLGSWNAQIYFSGSLLDSWKLIDGTPNDSFLRSIIKPFFEIFEIEGVLKTGVSPEWLGNQDRSLFVETVANLKVKTPLELTAAWKVKNDSGGEDDSKSPISIGASVDSKYSFEPNSPFDLTQILDKITLSASLKFPLISAAETAGFFTLDLTGSIGADWEITAIPNPIGGDYFPDNFGVALGVLGAGALAQGTLLLLTLDDSSNLSSAILADLAISLGETFGAFVNGVAEGLDLSSTIGFPIISAGLSGEIKIPIIPIFSVGVDIGTTAAVNWGLQGADTTFTLNFPLDFNVKLGPIGFGLDFYPGWSWTIFDNDNTSNAVTANTVLASESQAQVLGSLLYVDLGATFTDLPNPDDFTVTVTDISGNQEIISVFNVLQGNSDTSVILQLESVIPPSSNLDYTDSDNPNSTSNGIILNFTNREGIVDNQGNLIANITNLSVENNTPDSFNYSFNPTTGNSQNYSNSLAINTQSAFDNIEADLSQDSFLNLSLTKSGQVLATWVADVPPIEPIAGFVNGSVITLNFVDNLGNSSNNEPNLNQFIIKDQDDNSYTVENISNLGNSITLTLDRVVTEDTQLNISYQIASTTNNNESFYILNSTTNTKLWIDSFENLSLTNITATNNVPILLGVGSIVETVNSNKITLVFDQNLRGNPINSQFTVTSNGVNYIIEPTITVNNNTVILSVQPPNDSNLIGIGDIVTISYRGSNAQSQQQLTGNGGMVADFSNTPVITSPSTPTTVIKYGFGPSGDRLLSDVTSIPGSNGLNLYPVTALDQEGNNVVVWANIDSTNIPVNLTPGEYYTQEQFENITEILATADLYYSIYDSNTGQWSVAESLTEGAATPNETLAGTDSKIALGKGINGNLMATWLNTNNGETNIYWSTLSYNNGEASWSSPQILSTSAKPDPLTELTITSLNGQPSVFWTETQPPSYYELTTSEQPLIYYRLAETEGTTLVNEGIFGAGGNGTYEGEVTFNQTSALENTTTGKGDYNSAVLFNNGSKATSSNISLSDNAFTVEFWFNASEYGNGDTLSLLSLQGILDFYVVSSEPDRSFFRFRTTQDTYDSDNLNLTASQWYQIVLTYDGKSEQLALYFNGQPITISSLTTGDTGEEFLSDIQLDLPSNTSITLGDFNNNLFNVSLDEVAFYNKVLSYSNAPNNFNDIENLTGSDIAQILLNTNDIGNKYNSQYITPTPSGAKSYYVTYDSESNIWENPEQIEPEFQVIPTQLSNANKPEWDIVSATPANNNGNIAPNGTSDIYLPLNLTNQTINTVINSIEVTAQTGSGNTLTWSIGTGEGNQLGVVQDNKLLNPLNPNQSFSYTVLNPTLDFDLFVDAGSIDPSTLSNFQYSINGGNPVNFSPADVTSEPTTIDFNQVMGVATVTEANDSSLALIDSGFITNTDNVAIGYVISNGDLNNDDKTDVIIGNRGYTDTEGNVLENGTILILFGGGSVLSNNATNALTTTDLSGNPDGVLIKGIADSGDGNGDYSLSLATGDVNGDGFDDLIIGASNVNNGQGAVYVIYGSASLAGTTIDVTNLGSQGYTIIPNLSGSIAFGYSVAVGNFNGGNRADIAMGTPGANNGNGEVYVAYDGNTNYSTVYSSQIEGELAGYSLGVSAYKGTSSPSTFTKNTSDDLIIGAIGYNGNVNNDWAGADDLPDGTNDLNSYPSSSSVQLGAVYVFKSNGTTSNTFSSTPYVSYTGANIANSNGTANNVLAGSALATVDLDGDGIQDLAISAEGANDNNGGVYVVRGGVSSNSNRQNLATVANLNIVGGISKSETGSVITSAGDLNQDEYEDFLITAPQAGNGTGQSYVLFGPLNLSQIGETFDLNVTANDSKTTFLLNGSLPYQLAGTAGGNIGDVNGDGINDLMISAPNAGQVYSVYGHTWLADDGSIKLANISSDNGFVIDGNLYQGANNQPLSGNGKNVEILGDINGDGFADVLSGSEEGLIIVFGSSTEDLLDSATGNQDLIITLENDLITDVVKLGDYNGDGLKDFGVLSDNGDFYLVLGNTSLASQGNLTLTEFVINNAVNVNTIRDYNGDGYDDFILYDDNENATIYLGNKNGEFGGIYSGDTIRISDSNFVIDSLGDYNGDGYDDFGYGLPQNNIVDENNPIGNGQFTTYLGNANAEFNNPTTINPFEASIYSGVLTSSQWGIYGSTDSNSVVSINSTISTQGVDLSPSMVAYNGYLYMVRNDNNNNDLWVQRSRDGYNWEGEVYLGSNFQTNKKTSLAVFNNTLYLAFTDTSEKVMYASAVDDNSSVAGVRFNNPIQVSGNGQSQFSQDGPSLIEYQDQLYVFFISTEENKEIIYSTSDTANSGSWSSKKNIFASGFNQSSDHRVSTTIFNDKLYVAFTGNGNNSLNVASSGDGTSWSRTILSQFASSEGASIVAGNDQLYLFHEGATSDGGNDFQVFYPTSTDGVNWTNAIALDDNVIDDAPYATFFNQSIYVAMAALNDDSLNVYVSDPFYESNQTQQLGSQLQGIGDFNGDGIEDFAVLAESYITGIGVLEDLVYRNNQGAVLIYYGKTTGITDTSTPDVVLGYSTVSDGDDLYQITNFSSIGDFNGDGFDDIAIASPNTFLTTEKTEDGVVTVVFGGTNWGNQYSKDNPFDLRSLSNNQNPTDNSNDSGFTIEGLPSSQTGISLDGGNDVNGDGFSDFVIGAPGDDDNLSFVVFGSDFTQKINQTGSIGDDIMLGTATGETFIGGQGKDQIYTNGGVDVAYGANDDDFITVNDTNFRRLDGDTGTDILKFTGYNGQDWDLTKLSGRLHNFEILVIEDYGANTLTLNSLTVNQISDNNTVTIVMDKDDTLNLSSDFEQDGFVNQYNQKFIRYTSNTSSATVLVNSLSDVNYSPLNFSLYNTGVNDSGVKMPNATIGDTHYELTSFPTGSVEELIITDGNNTISSYIQPNQRNSNNTLTTVPGDYTYMTNLVIPDSVNPNGFSINGKWVSDDEGTAIKVNGITQNLSVNPNYNTGFVPFTLNEGFVLGNNSIEFTINNVGTSNNPTYLRVEFDNIFVANGNASVEFSAPSTNAPEVITIPQIDESASISGESNQGISSDVFTAENVDNSQTRLFVSNPTANEASGEVEFIIQRTGDLDKYVQAHYITADGRAKAGSDYHPVLGRLIFAPGETRKTVSVPLPLDDVYTGTREFGLLVTLEKESDTAINDRFSIYVNPTDGQIRNWNHIILDRALSVMNGDLEFRITANEGKAETKIYFEGNENFNSFYIFNSKTEKYEPFRLDGDVGAQLFDENGDGKNDGVILHLQDGSDYDLDGVQNGIIHKRGFFANGDTPEIILDTPMYRFQSLDTPSSYLYVGEEEKKSILQNYSNSFVEEGLAFYVSDTPEDDLSAFNRFRNTSLEGAYIYAGEEESDSIRANYPQFIDEGIAFYAYSQGAQMANNITRFQNAIGGAYLYTASPETDKVISDYGNSFNLEGIAFEALYI